LTEDPLGNRYFLREVMMRVNNVLVATALLGLTIGVAVRVMAQGPAPTGVPPVAQPNAQGARPGGGRGFGGLVPGQQRAPEDAMQTARGKTLYEIGCRGCHGADLRGGDLGGPNLLRSQLALSDRDGELIVPIIQGSRQAAGMPAVPMSPQDGKAVAAYVRSVVATIGRQGMPPSVGLPPPSVLVGNASAGQAYFAAKCSSCHSATGDLQGMAARIPDPKALQNTWVAGSGRSGRFAAAAPTQRSARTATVTLPSGESVEGRLVRIDDFLVTVALADGTTRTFTREDNVPKVDIRDPMKTHRDLLAVYTDKDIHDVTAYLVTLK
jgi:cytochrome c oxidase cbb3-type subunit 3